MHIPVLLKEAVNGLKLKKGDVVLDGTLGEGGHTADMCREADGKITLIGIDLDNDAISFVNKMFETDEGLNKCETYFVKDSFRNLDSVLDNLNIKKVDKILFDLGMSTATLENSNRGFSFRREEPLIMTYSKDSDDALFTAKDILNNWQEESIEDIIYGYGEEMFAKKIAKKIVEYRKKKPIETTTQLVEIISSAVSPEYRKKRKHFAVKTFQALRIAVNDEITTLKEGIGKAVKRLNKGGKLAIISFHSIEDRTVKNLFKKGEEEGKLKIITKKPIIPNEKEIEINPRSRSAKLRIVEKI